MNKCFLISVCLLAVLQSLTAEEVKHRFLCVDNARNHLLFIDQIENKEWIAKLPGGPRDLQIINEGKQVLVSHGKGLVVHDLQTGKKVAQIDAGIGSVNTARQLSNGNYLFGANSRQGVIFVERDSEKNEVSRTLIPKARDLRLVRVLENGNFLLTVSGPFRVIEADKKGEIVRSAKLPGKGYKVIGLENGSVMATSGADVQVVTIDRTG
ncbi:MAG: hypothetical protein QF886_20120, partial [Planctomycetota bacterium]|nr:hypothetical protein [Planctomycetota bacterium]